MQGTQGKNNKKYRRFPKTEERHKSLHFQRIHRLNELQNEHTRTTAYSL